MSIRPSIEDPEAVQDSAAKKVLKSVKAIVDVITGRAPGNAPIKTLGPNATLAGVINKVNEVIGRLQK
jgi:hypothetical protein